MSLNLPPLAQIAKQAGSMALAMQKAVVANQNGEQQTKSDGSVLTIADLEANRTICQELERHFPNIAIISEENSDAHNAAALLGDERFDTDPIDNTSAYARGRDGFSVNIGHIKNARVIAGVIYFPARAELYFTGADDKAYLQKGDDKPREIQVAQPPLRSPLQVAVGFSQQHLAHLNGHKYDVQRFPAQLRTCMVASGVCDLTGISKGQSSGYNSWDIAGPHAVLKAAGGDIVASNGAPIKYGKGTVKIPDHIAGAKDVLKSLGLGEALD